MKILCITHADFETPGVIETWAQKNNHPFIIKKPYKGESLPDTNTFDFLIVMGGPQSPLKLNEFPYLREEIALIQSAIAAHKKVLGFCLGAQLIGEALGAKTTRSPEKEVGVYPITLTDQAQSDPILKGLAQTLPVIHWHNDMPGLTSESVLLASSEGCPHQIVKYKTAVYGFQCHLEITLEGIKTMIEAVPEDLAPSKYTQNQQALLSNNYAEINNTMMRILDNFSAITLTDTKNISTESVV